MFEHFTNVAEMHFTAKSFETIPALNIEEVLAERPWKRGRKLSQEQQRDVHDGIKFLDLVIQGEKVVEQTRTQGIVSGDRDAVDAYDTTQKALQQYIADHKEIRFQKIIKTSKKVLRAISSGDKSPSQGFTTAELKIAHDLFVLLSQEFFTPEGNALLINMNDG